MFPLSLRLRTNLTSTKCAAYRLNRKPLIMRIRQPRELDDARSYIERFFDSAEQQMLKMARVAASLQSIIFLDPHPLIDDIFDLRTYSWHWNHVPMRLHGFSSRRFTLMFNFSSFTSHYLHVVIHVSSDLPPVVLPAFPYGKYSTLSCTDHVLFHLRAFELTCWGIRIF